MHCLQRTEQAGSPGTELQAVVSYYMDVGNQISVLFKSGKCY